METVLEVYTTEEQCSVLLPLWAKKHMQRIFIRKCLGGKFLSHKNVHNWVKEFSQGRSKVADDAGPGAEVAETTTKRLICCGFRHTGKAIGEVYQC
jgi:hypothetical protein